MRINRVKKSRKDQGNCSRCGVELPKGSAYRWIKFRYGGKIKRCMSSTCAFRQSDLTSSDKLSTLYACQEAIEDEMTHLRENLPDFNPEEIEGTFTALASTIEDQTYEVENVADEYDQSAQNLEEYFPGSEQVYECEEKANACREWYDELDSARQEAESAAESVTAGNYSASDLEAVLDEIENHVQSLEVY